MQVKKQENANPQNRGGCRQIAISYGMELEPKKIDVAMCITSRYYKGFSNYNPENAVLVIKEHDVK